MGRVRLGVCAEVLDALKQVLLDGAFVFDVEVYTSEGVTDTNAVAVTVILGESPFHDVGQGLDDAVFGLETENDAVAVCLNDVGVSFGELIILGIAVGSNFTTFELFGAECAKCAVSGGREDEGDDATDDTEETDAQDDYHSKTPFSERSIW